MNNLATAQRAYDNRLPPSYLSADSASERAHAILRREMLEALTTDPCRIVQTPGWTQHQAAAVDVVFDNMGATGDASLHELLCIVGMCAAGKLDHETHLRASAWIAKQAAAHAAWHRDDLADQLEAE